MVHRDVAVLVLAVLKLRELGDPQQLEIVGADEIQTLCQLTAQGTECDNRGLPVGIRNDEYQIAVLGAGALLDGCDLVLGHLLGERGGHLAVSAQLHPRQTLGAVGLDPLTQLVDLLAGELVRTALGVDQANRAAVRNHTLEYRERAVCTDIRDILDLHAEAEIRLVRTEAVHRFLPRHARERELDINTQNILEHALQEALVDGDDIVLLDERHLKVDLRELRLAVGAQVLIAETAGDLHIAVDTGQHQQLLVLLRRLRQSVERARMDTGRNQIVARALRRGLLQNRRLDLQESLLIEVVAGDLGDAVAQLEVALHGRTAQIQIAVLEPQLVVDLLVVRNLERGGLGLGQDAHVGHRDLDLTGRHLRVDGAIVALGNHAADRENVLHADTECDVEQVLVDRLIKRALDDARAVAQQQEQNAAVVAGPVTPAVEDNLAAGIRRTKLAAPVRPLHAVN